LYRRKSYAFALRIVKAYKYLAEEKKEFVLSKQLLRCGNSVGANIEEAIGGQTTKDFFAKLNIIQRSQRNNVLVTAFKR
jgi:four helix bundle protein